jgi:uncharacterized protein (TIGR00730 family)
MIRVGVFCGASPTAAPAYLEVAEATGAAIARRGFGMVYGGARSGLMGACARAALAGGAPVVGVLPEALAAREVAQPGLTDLIKVVSMTERKVVMTAFADAFLVLPGGLGTLDEMFEVATLAQVGMHQKPLCAVDAGGFFTHLRAFLAHATSEGLVQAPHAALVRWAATPEEALDRLELG